MVLNAARLEIHELTFHGMKTFRNVTLKDFEYDCPYLSNLLQADT